MGDNLRTAAERAMGRLAPDNENHPSKRQRTGNTDDDGIQSVQYEYSAAEALVDGSPGFLLSCTFKKEKAAVKEILPLLKKYIELSFERLSEKADGQQLLGLEGGSGGHSGLAPRLTLVKLACRGLMFMRLQAGDAKGSGQPRGPPEGTWGVPTAAARALISAIQAGAEAKLKYCQRVVPIERTCPLTCEALSETSRSCTALCLKEIVDAPAKTEGERTVTYAVRFQTRGHLRDGGPKKEEIIREVARGVDEACRGVAKPEVNLSSPEVAILGEAIPLASGEVLGMLCVATGGMFTAKPHLRICSVAG